MATRKTKAEAEKVWDSFHKFNPRLNFTIEFESGQYVEGEQIHILQVLKCDTCGSEIKTHAIGRHSGTCHLCTEKRNRRVAANAKTTKAQQYATWKAQDEYISLHGEEF